MSKGTKVDKLKECPFCGSNELLMFEKPSNDGTVTFFSLIHTAEISCGVSLTHINKDELIQNWNDRKVK